MPKDGTRITVVEGGIKLSDLLNAPAKTTARFAGQEIELTYKAGFFTDQVRDAYLNGEGDFAEKNKALIIENLLGWNITDEEGVMLPISAEYLGCFALSDAIASAMIRGESPNAQ